MTRESKQRLDELLIKLGLAPDLRAAKSLIMAGEVLVDDVPIDKVGTKIPESCVIRLRNRAKYVSRGGEKLAAALDHFELEISGRVVIDIGASTGGFTDCLLQRGAARVYAVDVGTNQLDWSLRNDPRVVSFEQTNARDLASLAEDRLVPMPDLAVIDVSFISPRLLIAPLLERCAERLREIVVLVKPQFELPGEQVVGGVVTDPALHNEACRMVTQALTDHGLKCSLPFLSPLPGQKKGNLEFFLRAEKIR